MPWAPKFYRRPAVIATRALMKLPTLEEYEAKANAEIVKAET